LGFQWVEAPDSKKSRPPQGLSFAVGNVSVAGFVNGVKNNGEKNVVNAKQEAQAAHAVLHGNITRCGLSANPFPLAKDNWPGVLGLLSEFHFGTILVSVLIRF
jgi:hypothetical protein